MQVDIPYSALEMLTSTAQDQVFYRVDGPEGFITGYEGLEVVPAGENPAFADGVFDGGAQGRWRCVWPRCGGTCDRRSGDSLQRYRGRVDTGAGCVGAGDPVAVSLATGGAVVVAAVVVWAVVTLALAPLNRLGEAIAERSPDDLRPVTGRPRAR